MTMHEHSEYVTFLLRLFISMIQTPHLVLLMSPHRKHTRSRPLSCDLEGFPCTSTARLYPSFHFAKACSTHNHYRHLWKQIFNNLIEPAAPCKLHM